MRRQFKEEQCKQMCDVKQKYGSDWTVIFTCGKWVVEKANSVSRAAGEFRPLYPILSLVPRLYLLYSISGKNILQLLYSDFQFEKGSET
jgi:hypothetical protein